MPIVNSNDKTYNYSVDFLGKECKNKLHNKCYSTWEGFAFQVVCSCECHNKKTVLGKDVGYEDSYSITSVATQIESEGK